MRLSGLSDELVQAPDGDTPVCADKDSGLAHTLKGTSANVYDVAATPGLLTGQEETVGGGSGYRGTETREDAADLFIALSRTISSLEQELQVQHFERTPRSVNLTPAGAAFMERCPAVLDSYRASVSAAQLAPRGFRGSLHVGIMRDSFEPCLPVIFREFHRLYPQISLVFQGYSHSKLLAAFEKDEVDALLNYLPLPAAKQNEDLVLLHRNQQRVLLHPDHPLAKRESLRMEELKNEPFVVMARTVSTPGHDFIWKTAAEAGFSPNVVAEVTQLSILLTLVACGIGISTLSDDMQYLAQGKVAFVPLLGVPLSNLVFMWHPDNSNPALVHLAETVRALAEAGALK